ncbi:MAG: hypothetical protein KDA61_11300, partial [Planctomycetales bacterium]|nr:hypothetical protein [Planctomycetales bacterium]
IIQSGSVDTNEFKLSVKTDTIVTGDGSLNVAGKAELNHATLLENGQLRMQGGNVSVNRLDNNATEGFGGIRGFGYLGVSDLLVNNERLVAENGLLQIAGPGNVDLDGATETGQVDVVAGDLEMGPGPQDPFDGAMIIGPDRYAALSSFNLGYGGTLFLWGNPGQPATITGRNPGDSHQFGGLVDVDGDAVISADLAIFDAFSSVDVPHGDDTLLLESAVTRLENGVRISGEGRLVQRGDIATHNSASGLVASIETEVFQWGSHDLSDPNELRVELGARLSISSPTTGRSGNPFEGDIVVAGGRLDVLFAGGWSLPDAQTLPTGQSFGLGTLKLFESENSPGLLRGTEITVAGVVQSLGGQSEIYADVTLLSSGRIQLLASASDLQLRENLTVLDGGSITGPGRLTQLGNIQVISDTSIDIGDFNWGNSVTGAFGDTETQLLVNPGVSLNIVAGLMGESDNEFRGHLNLNGGRLSVVNDVGFWTLPAFDDSIPGLERQPGVLRLAQPGSETPEVAGASVAVFGEIQMAASRATFDAALALAANSRTKFETEGILAFNKILQLAGGTIDHGSHHGTLLAEGTNPTLLWAGESSLLVSGDVQGSLDFALGPNTVVAVSPIQPAPTLTILPGATVNVLGTVDPFTDSTTPGRHVRIVNNSVDTFRIGAGRTIGVAAILGVGRTEVGAAATLTADDVRQSTVTVEPGGALQMRQGESAIATTSGLINAGLVRSDGGDLEVFGSVEHSGEFFVATGDELRFHDEVAGPGDFTGGGVVWFEDEYSPGASPGKISFAGSMGLTPTSNVLLEMAQAGGAPIADELIVHNTLMLDGMLTLRFLDGYVPTDGTKFELFSAERLTGNFDAIEFPELPGGLSWSLSTTAKRLTIAFNEISGDADFDRDGNVNGADFLTWQRGRGIATGAIPAQGDADGNGAVDHHDLSLWQAQFSGVNASKFAVPEPASANLLVLAVACSLAGRCSINIFRK